MHESAHARTYHGVSVTGEPVLIKIPISDNPTVRVLARYQRAFDLGVQASSEAVVRHIELLRYRSTVALITEDMGGVSLETLIQESGIPIERFLEIAVQIAAALSALHASGVIHKDINPTNIIIAPDKLRLSDLGISSRLGSELAEARRLDQIEGTLAYMSPEQSGRIHSIVDERSDLYSLGVTLFQLASGRLPFEDSEAAALVHAHVARPPPKLSSLKREIPPVICEIITRLLEKNADDRYSSAMGLLLDLRRCLDAWRFWGIIRAFPLGSSDANARFRLPGHLYGRSDDRDRLLNAFKQACAGQRVLVTVAGKSGVGKTALVDDVYRRISLSGGYFCSGKFDQFRPDIPYLGVLIALRGLLRRELAEPEAVLALRRKALQEAMGGLGRLLSDVLPELAQIIGPQPEVAEVPYWDAGRRLYRLASRFLCVFASQEQPLVLFLDDLQWADPPSLQLLEAFAADPALSHLMLVMGYRSNEMGEGHPARSTLAALARTASVVETIALEPLTVEDISQLVADTLHTTVEDVRPLSARIHMVAAGNPFFVREYLHTLYTVGFFRFDASLQAWQWSLGSLVDHNIPDSVVDLLTLRLADLASNCLDILDTASCVGSEFDLRTLASVHEIDQGTAALALSPAIQAGLVVPLDTEYKLFESLGHWRFEEDDQRAPQMAWGTARYRFQHDRVRQTVHERLDRERRTERHLRIGRLLLKSLQGEERSQRAVEIFDHIVYGADHITDPAERRHLARLGLEAGCSAQRALAFSSARRLLWVAAQMLSSTAWHDDYETAFGIHMALAECAHALVLNDIFEEEAEIVIAHARSVVDASHAHGLRIRVKNTQSRYAEAVDIGIRVAASLGVRLPRKPNMLHILWNMARTLWAQRGRDPLALEGLPESKDQRIAAAISVLCQSASAAYFAEPNLVPLIGMVATRLSIQYGHTTRSPYAFGVWALVLCGVLGRIENGHRFGRLGLLVGRHYGGLDEARARFLHDCFVRHWKEPLPDVAHELYLSWAQNRDSGDEESATYSAGVMLYTHFFAGGSVDVHERYIEPIRYLQDCDQPHVKHSFLAWVQLFHALRQAELPKELAGEWFNYPEQLPGFEATNNRVQIAISSIAAGILDHLANRFERAEARFARAAQFEENVVGQVLVPGLAFFRALNLWRLIAAGHPKRRTLLRIAQQQTRRLMAWLPFAPMNIAPRLSLLQAEAFIHARKHEAAMDALHRCFDQAAGGAFLYQALAARRLAEILPQGGLAQAAIEWQSRADQRFGAWGSPALLMGRPLPRHVGLSTDNTDLMKLDLQALLKALAAITSEFDEQRLLDKLMTTAIEAAGADRGVLLLFDDDGQLTVDIDIRIGQPPQRRRVPVEQAEDLARPLLDLARRSTGFIIVDDAAADPLLSGDPHIAASGVRALLSGTMTVSGRSIGLLYFENHVARHAFAGGRALITEAIGSQAGIALENARLYGRVQAALQAQTALTVANRRFVPHEFVAGLGFNSIVDVQLNVAREGEMSVLFIDLRGFSSLALEQGALRTVQMINRYLSHVQPGISTNRGFVGQYYGDGVLALFPHAADDALQGAIAMCRGLESYNRHRGDFPALSFGMGLHSGAITLGTLGDPDHFQCAVIGDAVNLASRMEGLSKHFNATLVLSGETQKRLSHSMALGLRSLGKVQVVGRAGIIDVYECMACYGPVIRDHLLQTLPIYQDALNAYCEGHWAAAAIAFDACVSACPEDRVSAAFSARAHARVGQNIPWMGVEQPGKGKE